MDFQQAQYLVEHEQAVDLTRLALQSGESELKVRARLEKEHPAKMCRALLDCAQTQLRFRHKFRNSESWLLTREAAEQASHYAIAEWRTRWLAEEHPGVDLTEVGSGIGGDTVSLSNRPLIAYEQDPGRALLCRRNVERLGDPRSFEMRVESADLALLEGALLFCDPGRRSGARISHPEGWNPPLSQVLKVVDDKRFEAVLVKVAPGIDVDSYRVGHSALQAVFLSVDGELKECQLRLAQELSAGTTRAVLLSVDPSRPDLVYEAAGSSIPIECPRPGQFLHNPDPAILRAGALDSLAEELDAAIVHPKIGYLVGGSPCRTPAAESFEVMETLPLKWSQLKRRLSDVGWGDYEYLGRGVPFSQVEVRKKLSKLKGTGKVRGSLIIYRHESGYQAVLARRLTRESSPGLK